MPSDYRARRATHGPTPVGGQIKGVKENQRGLQFPFLRRSDPNFTTNELVLGNGNLTNFAGEPILDER